MNRHPTPKKRIPPDTPGRQPMGAVNPAYTNRRLRLRNTLITLLFFFIALLLVYLFITQCRVARLDIVGALHVSEVLITDAAQIRAGTHLYALNTGKIESAVFAASPYIKSVTVQRRLPSGVRLTVTEYEPLFYIEAEGGYFILSRELFVLEQVIAEAEAAAAAPIRLSLPETKPPQVSTALVFADKTTGKDTVATLGQFLSSPLADKLASLDLSEKHDIRCTLSGGKYLFLCGSVNGLPEKLLRCGKTLAYLDANMRHIKGTLRAEGTTAISFEITGVAE